MRPTLVVGLIVMVALPMMAQAQDDFDEIAAMQALERRIESYRVMGMRSGEALEAAIITSPGLSMQQRVLLLGRVTDDPVMRMMGPALLGQGAGGGTGITAHGESLFVAENGWIYRIDPETLEVMQSARYRTETASDADLGSYLDPMLEQAREEAQGSACLSNMKQLCLAALMYTQDWNERLVQPGRAAGEWPEELHSYIMDRAIFKCPSRPEQPVGYAFNERLYDAALANITNPAETVIMFETLAVGEAPAGGVELVPAQPIHGDYVTVGFVDGHVKMMTPEALREALERDPFE
jgi:prepilin-type processing-associated H-X9-DG protein